MADDNAERARAYWQSLATAERQDAAAARAAVRAAQTNQPEQEQRNVQRRRQTLRQ